MLLDILKKGGGEDGVNTRKENALEDDLVEDELEEGDVEEEEEKPLRMAALDILKDVVIAFIIVMIIIGGIYVYTGNWPPVVVVESKSMQHSDTESFLGVIDTGDLVLVKRIESDNDVIPYMEGKRVGHETYSGYGDVLIYNKNGYKDITPVIHRSIIYLKLNETTNNSFDIPELKHHKFGLDEEWYVTEDGAIVNRWYDLHNHVLYLKDIGHKHVDLQIPLGSIFNNFQSRGVAPHGGFITLGDNNRDGYDQKTLRDEHDRFGTLLGSNRGEVVEPIQAEWIVGKARGELPWFGLIKLYFQDSTIRDRAPENSWTMLYISIILIFAIPICIDVFLLLYERKKEKKEEEAKKGEKETKDEEEAGDEIEEEPPPPDEEEIGEESLPDDDDEIKEEPLPSYEQEELPPPPPP